MRKSLSLAAATLGVLGALTLAPNAHAQDGRSAVATPQSSGLTHFSMGRSVYLAATSGGVVDVPYGGAGTNFTLISGWYRWEYSVGGETITRSIHLAGGSYNAECVLVGGGSGGDTNYGGQCGLRPASGATALLPGDYLWAYSLTPGTYYLEMSLAMTSS